MENRQIRYAIEADVPLILDFIRKLAQYENMLDEVVADEQTLRTCLFEKRSAEVIFVLEQGKEVFALLGNNSPQNEGSNNRIKEGSAIPVTDFMDILNSFDNLYATNGSVDFDNISLKDVESIPVKGRNNFRNSARTTESISKKENIIDNIIDNTKKEIKHKNNLNLNPTAQKIYEYISDEPVHIDKISSDLNIPVFKVLASITELEMNNLVTALQGRRYILK